MEEKEELIEKYFEKSLSAEEQVHFDQYLKTDPEFAAEVAFQKNVKEAIEANKRDDLKLRLKSYEQAAGTKRNFPTWYAAAALLLFSGVAFYFYTREPDSEALYEAYYQSYPNVIAPTVRGENTEDIKNQAFYDYDNGDYEASLKLFSEIYEKNKDDFALFYLSMSLLELGRHEEALASFDKFDLNKNNGFTPFVKWYKSLAYLKTDQKEKAIVLLESLSSTVNPQTEMAKKLLSELK
jgi:tetratricopeptide (TPR) repeat protein